MAEDTAQAKQRTERAAGEQEPSGTGRRTRNTTHRAGTQVKMS